MCQLLFECVGDKCNALTFFHFAFSKVVSRAVNENVMDCLISQRETQLSTEHDFEEEKEAVDENEHKVHQSLQVYISVFTGLFNVSHWGRGIKKEFAFQNDNKMMIILFQQ